MLLEASEHNTQASQMPLFSFGKDNHIFQVD